MNYSSKLLELIKERYWDSPSEPIDPSEILKMIPRKYKSKSEEEISLYKALGGLLELRTDIEGKENPFFKSIPLKWNNIKFLFNPEVVELIMKGTEKD